MLRLKNLLLNIFGSSRNSERSTFNKDLSAFIICLLVSGFCWFLIVLSKNYDQRNTYKVNYSELPQNKSLVNRLPDSIEISLRTSGFSLLREKLFSSNRIIFVDCSNLRLSSDSISFLSTASVTEKLEKQLGNNYSITKIFPDTVFFNFSARSSKIVPVKLNISLGFEKQFQLSDSITIEPSHVTVYGAKEVLSKIDHVLTDYLVLNKLSKPVTKRLGFADGGRGLGFSSDSVKVTIQVDQFTEGNIQVPIEPINLPNGYSLKLFPDKVDLRFIVGISNLSKLNPSLFKVVVDYSKAGDGSNSKLKVELVDSPSYINGIKMEPEKVEFIIRKK